MILRLWFDITASHDDEDWSVGMFAITNPIISGTGEDLEFSYDAIRLFLSSEGTMNAYNGGIPSWHSNSMSTSEIFESVLNSYLRDEHTHTSPENDSWNFFDPFKELRVEEDFLLMKLPQVSLGSVEMYSLQLATNDRCYYACDDNFMVINNDNEIVTDYECFYTSALGEDLADIILKKSRCLYMGEDVKCWIDTEGEDYIVSVYKKESEK